jgi:hypothetical protein
MLIALQIVAWFVALSVFMSLVEHQVHARLMHRRPKFFLFRNLRARTKIFTSHALEHHSQYREEFHDEPLGAVMFPIVVVLHHLTWNAVHLEMHQPKGRFFGSTRLFKKLARHHYLHHRYPAKNFNVFLLVGDYVFGTMAKPTAEDWAEMRRQGLTDDLPATLVSDEKPTRAAA